MNQIVLDDDYCLNVIFESENFLDTKILHKGIEIGELLLTFHKDEIFIRQISIKEKYRRSGHSTNIVNALREHFKRPISLCVSKHSESAIGFWKSYFDGKNVHRIRGDIYKIT